MSHSNEAGHRSVANNRSTRKHSQLFVDRRPSAIQQQKFQAGLRHQLVQPRKLSTGEYRLGQRKEVSVPTEGNSKKEITKTLTEWAKYAEDRRKPPKKKKQAVLSEEIVDELDFAGRTIKDTIDYIADFTEEDMDLKVRRMLRDDVLEGITVLDESASMIVYLAKNPYAIAPPPEKKSIFKKKGNNDQKAPMKGVTKISLAFTILENRKRTGGAPGVLNIEAGNKKAQGVYEHYGFKKDPSGVNEMTMSVEDTQVFLNKYLEGVKERVDIPEELLAYANLEN